MISMYHISRRAPVSESVHEYIYDYGIIYGVVVVPDHLWIFMSIMSFEVARVAKDYL